MELIKTMRLPCLLKPLSIFLALGLGGCGTALQPHFMPAGYTYHNEEFKAPPGPEASSLGYDYTPQQNQEMMRIWRDVAVDAINAFEAQTGLAAQPVYLGSPLEGDAFHRSLDYALREELMARGYTFPGFEGGHLNLRAAIYLDTNEDAKPDKNNCQPEQGWRAYRCKKGLIRSYTLVLQGFRRDALLGGIKRSYTLPDYGYRGSGVRYTLPPQQDFYNR